MLTSISITGSRILHSPTLLQKQSAQPSIFSLSLDRHCFKGLLTMLFMYIYLTWSYWTKSLGFSDFVVYFAITLSSIRARPRNKLKQPGLHNTQPITCSVAFCSQWPIAYSNFWYQTINPEPLVIKTICIHYFHHVIHKLLVKFHLLGESFHKQLQGLDLFSSGQPIGGLTSAESLFF